jgi:CspA family cold shock protein
VASNMSSKILPSSSLAAECLSPGTEHEASVTAKDEPPPRYSGGLPRHEELDVSSDFPIQSVVKWFDSQKGFGFVELSDGSGDALLHMSVLARSDISAVQPGERLKVLVGPGHKGQHVCEVLNVHSSSAIPPVRVRTRIARSSGPPIKETGTVRFFSPKRGYGFIGRDQGGRDAYVETYTLARCDIRTLSKGQRVIVKVVERGRGPKAVWLRLIGLDQEQTEC